MDDSISFLCAFCGAELKAPRTTAGRNGRCNHCQHAVMVPAQFVNEEPLRPQVPASAPPIGDFVAPALLGSRPTFHQKRGLIKQLALIVVGLAVMAGGGLVVWNAVVQNDRAVSLRAKPPAVPLSDPATSGPTDLTPREKNLAELAERVSPSVVTITTERNNSGAGFVAFEANLVFTHFQVLSGSRAFRVHFFRQGQDAIQVPGTVVAVDKDHDLALMAVENPTSARPLALRVDAQVPAGAEIFFLARPSQGATQLTVLSGSLSDPAYEFAGQRYLQTTIAINPDQRGGPLMDIFGAVWGVATVTTVRQDNRGFALPIAWAKALYAGRKGAFKLVGDFAGWESTSLVSPQSGKKP